MKNVVKMSLRCVLHVEGKDKFTIGQGDRKKNVLDVVVKGT